MELPLEGSAVLYLLPELLGSFKLFLKFISKIAALVRRGSLSILNTQRRHKPERKVFSADMASLLDWGRGELQKEDFKTPYEKRSALLTRNWWSWEYK